jgi:hypothetical protein
MRNHFDTFGTEADRREYTQCITINATPYKYTVTTYPDIQGCEGFQTKVWVNGGLFSKERPQQVEFSLSDQPEHYDFLLAGEEGFELAEDMHRQLAELKDPLTDAMAVAGVRLPHPESLQYQSDIGGGVSLFHDRQEVVLNRCSNYVITDGSGNGTATINLDSNLTQPLSEYGTPFKRDPMVFRSGTVEFNDRLTLISDEGLMAFAGLHSTIQKLYR